MKGTKKCYVWRILEGTPEQQQYWTRYTRFTAQQTSRVFGKTSKSNPLVVVTAQGREGVLPVLHVNVYSEIYSSEVSDDVEYIIRNKVDKKIHETLHYKQQ